MAMVPQLLRQQYHHVALPRDVPGSEDQDILAIDAALLDRLTDAVIEITPLVQLEHQPLVDAVRLTLDTSKMLNAGGMFDQHLLSKKMSELNGEHVLVLHITEQNAAILMYKEAVELDNERLVIEAFEASAECEAVLASKNALVWTFPGRAVSISSDIYRLQPFQASLASFLERASIESLKQFAAVTYKASLPLPEIRGTTNPSLVTGLLMTILESNGMDHNVPRLQKRIRDTVSFKQARKPWRRSPFYLVLRVAIQRHLYRIMGPDLGRSYFKIIMSVFISGLLDDAYASLPREASYFLVQKLSRRLAKIEEYGSGLLGSAKIAHDALFSNLKDKFTQSLTTAKRFLDFQWETYRERSRRIIKPLPTRATPSALTLQLPASGHRLDLIAFRSAWITPKHDLSPLQRMEQYESSRTRARPFARLADRYIHVATILEEHVLPMKSAPIMLTEWDSRCCSIASAIELYVPSAGNLFDGYPTLKSKLLLEVLELWVELDRYATVGFPLLKSYHPGFNATEDSFAAVYYDKFGAATGLMQVYDEIQLKAERERKATAKDWQEKNERHKTFLVRSEEELCPGYENVEIGDGTTKTKHKSRCLKHEYAWAARNIEMKIFEKPLPDDEAAAKTVVFELKCPKPFAAYRDTTWALLATFGHVPVEPREDVYMLREYTRLSGYVNSTRPHVTMASTKKSHLICHFNTVKFPVTLEQVCRPCGLTFDYYDTTSRSWTYRKQNPSFTTHVPLMLPENSPYHCLDLGNDEWPSSNEIIAGQTKCPHDLNVHEFMAWQGLLGTTHGRWLSFLRELGASNLNFSSESTLAAVSKVILQVGPCSLDHRLRDIHVVFDDQTFCSRLLDQISRRLDSIRRNWREPVQMYMIMYVLIKTISLCSYPKAQHKASKLLSQARTATWGWCVALQSSNEPISPETTTFVLWASVLCKRSVQRSTESMLCLNTASLQCYIGASIILQENLVGQFDNLPCSLRQLLLEDALYAFHNRKDLAIAIATNHEALLSALNEICQLPSDIVEEAPQIQLMKRTGWVEVSMKSHKRSTPHFIHYHFIRGDLLIDGMQSGILPDEYRHPAIKDLFGKQVLRFRPSFQLGMSVSIAHPMPHGHWIHLGRRQDKLVMRAVQGGNTLELIDHSMFSLTTGNSTTYDLPWALIGNCYHWLNIDTGILEIRQDEIWKSKPSNWKLDLRNRQATRKKSMLVDIFSPVVQTVVQNFRFFEEPKHIIVTQPKDGPLSVELKRLELSFFVNRFKLLPCRELAAEIVYTNLQDVGTWYGCRSKIVLRSTRNQRQRMVLVPEGELRSWKNEDHVTTEVANSGSYLKFEVDDVLGRMHCPAEHRLLYTKALWHAYTTHCLPDPLTGRTGLDEALYLLKTGLYKPWTTLPDYFLGILTKIAHLSPRRVYYPAELKCMETVNWNQNLTKTIQDDRYRPIVQNIYERALQLRLFQTTPPESSSQAFPLGDSHLECRSLSRLGAAVSNSDTTYHSRDRGSAEYNDVALITKLLSEWSLDIANSHDLTHLLQDYAVIGGLDKPFQDVRIHDLISANLVEKWGALVLTAIQSGPDDRYHLMFIFGPMATSPYASIDLIQVLVSYAILPALKNVEYPRWPSYVRFKSNEIPGAKSLAELMKDAHEPHMAIPSKKPEKSGQMALARIKHQEACAYNCVELAKSISLQWPQIEIELARLPTVDPKFLDTKRALEPVMIEWRRCVQNFEFSGYLQQIQHILDEYATTIDSSMHDHSCKDSISCQETVTYPFRKSSAIPSLRELLLNVTPPGELSVQSEPTQVGHIIRPEEALQQLLSGHSPAMQAKKHIGKDKKTRSQPHSLPCLVELSDIVEGFRQESLGSPGSSVQRDYANELLDSVQTLEKRVSQPSTALAPLNISGLKQLIENSQIACNEALYSLTQALAANHNGAAWLRLGGLWPTTNRLTLLSELRSTSHSKFGPGTKEAIVNLGVRIASLQQLLRIEDAYLKHKTEQMQDECTNQGHVNWDPMVQTDWLLLEIDSNIMFRSEQIDVANATIAPPSGCNSVVQLLMGKGKTSCILPMVASVLADKRHLPRIIVPRALLLQSAQVMHLKLGGLLDRELLHIPFSRQTKVDNDLLKAFSDLHNSIRESGGVMLCLPENILSFKLGGLQRLCDENLEQAATMIKLQKWLDRHARDVLYECDASLAIRTQLIYPSGSQLAVDGHPLRWQTVQSILRLLSLYLPELETKYPRSIEVVERTNGDFPILYLLRRDVEDYLVSRIVDAICNGQLTVLPYTEIPTEAKEDIRAFISSPTVSSQAVANVRKMFEEKQHLMKTLYLLRGLFVYRIFVSTLKKRWNVQYGLSAERHPIAVPYHAKGVPSLTSEWGHPDVMIILTCLSFYYEGVDLNRFKQAFQQLLKSDEPSIEYEKWATKTLPDYLRDYSTINVEDSTQLRDLHLHLRFNVYLIDFYLNNFVFPKHAKQFDTKLQASGWDLVLFNPAKASNCKTTGFSGTNDSRHQLPMTIKQNDLPDLVHTNAEVLSYLLEPRSREYVRMVDGFGHRWSEEGLLQEMSNPNRPNATERIRILIDAGAQILEHDNRSLARAWLKIDWKATAAVYFDSDHRAWVEYRKGKRLPLLASPYAENLEDCVVYLDESHCRGTDLKLPSNARAALTLGPHVTKDSIAQAAMRLRLLGRSQAVTFFSPPEVDHTIVDMKKQRKSKGPIDTSHVIAWLLKQSCNGIEQIEPLYFNQGNTYILQEQAKIEFPNALTNIHQRSEYLSVIRTIESQTLKQMYEPKHLKRGNEVLFNKGQLGAFAVKLKSRKTEFQDSGIAVHSSALEEVEQEREIEHEVENVREPEKPIHFDALRIPRLHKDILEFAKTGSLSETSDAYQPMLSALQLTASGRKHGAFVGSKDSELFISKQFSRTVKVVEPNDNFLRPCQWILWSVKTRKALVLSPEEADAVLSLLRRHCRPKNEHNSHTHLIVYSAPITRRMLHFNDLDYHATPPLPQNFKMPLWLKIQLGVFSGRLYFGWDEYKEILKYLGVNAGVEEEEGLGGLSREPFVKRPLAFLHDWLAVIRKGQDFEHTPMGFVTTGKLLSAEHPFFQTSVVDELENDMSSTINARAQVHEEGESEGEDDDDDEDIDEHGSEDDNTAYEDADDEETFFDACESTFFDVPDGIESDEEECGKGRVKVELAEGDD